MARRKGLLTVTVITCTAAAAILLLMWLNRDPLPGDGRRVTGVEFIGSYVEGQEYETVEPLLVTHSSWARDQTWLTPRENFKVLVAQFESGESPSRTTVVSELPAGSRITFLGARLATGINYTRVSVWGHCDANGGTVVRLGRISLVNGDSMMRYYHGPDPHYLRLIKKPR